MHPYACHIHVYGYIEKNIYLIRIKASLFRFYTREMNIYRDKVNVKDHTDTHSKVGF